jgi:hypothetical protein
MGLGDLICDGPDYASYFRVQHIDPPHALEYRSIRHPRRGSTIGITYPDSPWKVEKQLRASGTYFDFTWTLVLNGLAGHRTRLLVRATTVRGLPHALSRRWGWLTRPTVSLCCARSPAVLEGLEPAVRKP